MDHSCYNSKERSDLIHSSVELFRIIDFKEGKYKESYTVDRVKGVLDVAKQFLYIPEINKRFKKIKDIYNLE